MRTLFYRKPEYEITEFALFPAHRFLGFPLGHFVRFLNFLSPESASIRYRSLSFFGAICLWLIFFRVFGVLYRQNGTCHKSANCVFELSVARKRIRQISDPIIFGAFSLWFVFFRVFGFLYRQNGACRKNGAFHKSANYEAAYPLLYVD